MKQKMRICSSASVAASRIVESTPAVKAPSISTLLKIRNFHFHLNKLYHDKKEYSKVALSLQAQDALQQMFNVLTTKHYSKRTIRNYTQEMRFIFAHHPGQ
jgi:hypothetical protein